MTRRICDCPDPGVGRGDRCLAKCWCNCPCHREPDMAEYERQRVAELERKLGPSYYERER